MSKLLVASNCQTEGMKNSLSLLCPEIRVDSCDYWGLQRNTAEWSDRFPEYDYIVATHENIESFPDVFSRNSNVIGMPSVLFRGFQPDQCYAGTADGLIQTALADYHSTIALAGFNSGFSERETELLYADSVYQAIGYYDVWPSERNNLIATFKNSGFDLGETFLRWVRQPGSFMYGLNHPKINVIHDVAALVAQSTGLSIVRSEHIPHDNLASTIVFPVYPEIARKLGIEGGSYYFKQLSSYRLLSLTDFVDSSFAEYRKHGVGTITCNSPHYHHALEMFKGL